jgi:hypothetical protein
MQLYNFKIELMVELQDISHEFCKFQNPLSWHIIQILEECTTQSNHHIYVLIYWYLYLMSSVHKPVTFKLFIEKNKLLVLIMLQE